MPELKYVWGYSGSTAKTLQEKPDLASSLCRFVKIPKGSTNIHFEIPYYEVSKSWIDTKTQAGDSSLVIRNDAWPKDGSIPVQLRNLLDSTNTAEGNLNPEFSYKTWDVASSDLLCLFFNRSHSASIQVFHTDGSLLSGTPLYRWDTCIGKAELEESNGYIGGQYSPAVTEEGEARWWKCGIWAEWYSRVSALAVAGGVETPEEVKNYLLPTGTVVSSSDITAKLKSLYPDVFLADFSFDDSNVNNTRSEVIKRSNATMHTIYAGDEVIKWTGSIGGATGIGAVDHRAQFEGTYVMSQIGSSSAYNLVALASPSEVLDIEVANEDLIIGFLSTDGFLAWGSWIEPTAILSYPDESDDDTDPIEPSPLPNPTFEDFEFRPVYRNLENISPVFRGDDQVIPKPYAGVVGFRDGRYIVASRDRGKLAMMRPDGSVICTADPLWRRHGAEKTVCYGIALHVNEKTLYLLVGEEDSHELWVTRVEIQYVSGRGQEIGVHLSDNTPKPNVESISGSMM